MTNSLTAEKLAALMPLEALEQAAECLKTLAHPHRLRMVQMLLRDRYTVGELAEACGIPSHMASEHLRLMQRCGFLDNEKEGRKAYYRIVEMHLAASWPASNRVSAARRTEETSSQGETMSFTNISPASLANLPARPEDRTDRRPHAGRVPRSPLSVRPQCSLGPARSAGRDEGRNGSRGEPLYVICKSGGRSRQACEKFISAGFTNVVNVEGGTTACVEAGLPAVHGKRPSRWSGRSALPPGRWCCWGRSVRVAIQPPHLASRHSSAAAWCSPESRTRAAWACSWPACRGTSAAAKMVLLAVANWLPRRVRSAQRRRTTCRNVVSLHRPHLPRIHGNETCNCRWRGGRGIGRGAGPPPVGRARHRALRARSGRLVRQLRAALLYWRDDCPAREAAGHDSPAPARAIQSRRPYPHIGRGHRPRGEEGPRPRSGVRTRI